MEIYKYPRCLVGSLFNPENLICLNDHGVTNKSLFRQSSRLNQAFPLYVVINFSSSEMKEHLEKHIDPKYKLSMHRRLNF